MDQAEEIARRLEKFDAGKTVDLAAHFGYLATWHLAGPFDSPEGKGFALAFPAEKGFDPAATFECSLDGSPFQACSSAAGYTGLATGAHEFDVRAVDAAGNIDPTPAAYTWSIS